MTSVLDNQSLYLLHLLSCALRGEAPAPLPAGVTWDGLFALAHWNSVTTTCAFAVASSPEADSTERARWQAEVDHNLMRHAVFDMEREAVFAAMDEAGLAHLPLKGVVTSRAYPRPEMRWMCDNDFLFGRAREDGSVAAATEADARELRRIMESQGFTTAHFGTGNHDSYEKAPFLNFEPHRVLANPEVAWWKYYADPWAKARRVEGTSGLAYEFAREDAYLFHIAHMFKHYSASGHGARGLADEWALMRAWGGSMDRAYLDCELQKLGMADFEADLRRVAHAVVEKDACGRALAGDGGALAPDVERMLAYMLGSGTYGTVANNVRNQLEEEAAEGGKKGSRARYLLKRAFPPLKKLQQGYPVLKRAPWLLPGVYAYRLVVKPFTRTARLRTELSTVMHEGEE